MKYLAILICAATLTACETTYDDDGRPIKQTVNWDAVTRGVDTSLSAYDRYQRQRSIIGYAPDGTPIYQAY